MKTVWRENKISIKFIVGCGIVIFAKFGINEKKIMKENPQHFDKKYTKLQGFLVQGTREYVLGQDPRSMPAARARLRYDSET